MSGCMHTLCVCVCMFIEKVFVCMCVYLTTYGSLNVQTYVLWNIHHTHPHTHTHTHSESSTIFINFCSCEGEVVEEEEVMDYDSAMKEVLMHDPTSKLMGHVCSHL